MAAQRSLTRRQHRQAALDAFNGAWRLLDERRRTPRENLLMVHMARGSRYHWEIAGTSKNWAIGEWQVSHVYAVQKRPEPALYHAKRCLGICRSNEIGDFPLAYASEALARASAISGRRKDRDRYVRLAEAAGGSIREDADRELFFRDIATVPRR